MTAPARISQADMERATKAVAAAGLTARIIMRLSKAEIEIIVGDAAPIESGNAFDEG